MYGWLVRAYFFAGVGMYGPDTHYEDWAAGRIVFEDCRQLKTQYDEHSYNGCDCLRIAAHVLISLAV